MEVSPIDTVNINSKKKRNIGKKIFQGRYVYLMFLPVFIYFLVFAYLPMRCWFTLGVRVICH